jgi:hypothetical protein
MNPMVHFEMPAEDRKRMADFFPGHRGEPSGDVAAVAPYASPSDVKTMIVEC